MPGSLMSYHLTSRAQLIYLRAGNSCSEPIYLVLLRDGKTMRFFPIGAKASEHVPLVVVEAFRQIPNSKCCSPLPRKQADISCWI